MSEHPSPQDSPVWPPASDPAAPPAGPTSGPTSGPGAGPVAGPWGAGTAGQPAPTTAGGQPAYPQDGAHVPMDQVWTVFSSAKRVGTWRVPPHLVLSVAVGEVRLDLREAELSSPVTTIEVRGLVGDVKIIVPDRYRLECTGSAVIGEFEHKESGPTAPVPDGAPVVRVIGAMLLGEATVYRTGAAVGEGAFSVDGLTGVRARRRLRREQRRAGRQALGGR